ncbi:MAG: 16S rRNA (cytosine(1402)-N(4))-methyltransferase RsmH [Firmicutes bacterium]|nr:16S rRNA (cytosine(1402)-N(4))-methyltransferase RsmH [Bacillota bacterium]
MEFSHIPVLFEETIESLDVQSDGIYVDCTAGGGNHSAAILQRLGGQGRLICLDRDPDAIETVTARFAGDSRVSVVHTRYSAVADVLSSLRISSVNGILMDIGVSSHQVDTAERGFSFHKDAPLDMRMSREGTTAADLCNTLSWQQLAEIFTRYGEEKFSVRIAKAICEEREKCPVTTTAGLAEIISSAVPAAAKRGGHPARKVFQALRIAVNDELGELERGLQSAFECLAENGRLSVITFHSLEDRIVKQTMHKWCEGCTCPPEFPVCVCGNKPKAKLLFRKPVVPSQEELERNPRSRSSKLRTCIKLPNQ